jgi:isopentenyl-diphosphate delta-isomerase
VALGADLAGIAGPFLRAAVAGAEEARGLAREVVEVLRIAMFCAGARTLADLRTVPLLDSRDL